MIHFASLEAAGLRVAAMSDKSDGDCSNRPEAQTTVARFLKSLSVPPDTLVRLRQIHGNRVVEAQSAMVGRHAALEEADGLVSRESGRTLGIGVADCTPVLLYDPHHKAVALLHAGREGTLRNIAAAGVRTLCKRYRCDPAALRAAIGPCAGECCYEVSAECAGKWRDAGLPLRGRHLRLQASNCIQLENAGLLRHNIEVVPHCTICGGLFFSYRAGEISNRNLVVMML
ncbi:MAG: Laccase domain protein [Candidatus Hydrogenedentes bacterium ADurb.Bin101]|jgi:YfiH family protein|nr:MAG: Laccase domain protein [Candidatus Hydrogenedentes bacterium ADurb.Bin101]HOC68327.1 polyphenol oxidase family protein [Candidatus Hydrogenedentota bacterium]